MRKLPLSPNKIADPITKMGMKHLQEIFFGNNIKLMDKSKLLVSNVNSNVNSQNEVKLVDVPISLLN